MDGFWVSFVLGELRQAVQLKGDLFCVALRVICS